MNLLDILIVAGICVWITAAAFFSFRKKKRGGCCGGCCAGCTGDCSRCGK